jgi:death-on-curing protein
MEPAFLSLDEVLEIHEQQIERYGGSSGLRDAAGLESAVATPQATFGGEFLHTSIPAMAAAYLFHLCQNHPFIDGNKRVGANAAITFLRMNDWEPTFDRGRTRGCGSVRCFRWAEQTTADGDLRAPLQASRKGLKPRQEAEPAREHKPSAHEFGSPSPGSEPAWLRRSQTHSAAGNRGF